MWICGRELGAVCKHARGLGAKTTPDGGLERVESYWRPKRIPGIKYRSRVGDENSCHDEQGSDEKVKELEGNVRPFFEPLSLPAHLKAKIANCVLQIDES